MRLDFVDLKFFLLLAEAGNLTVAAERYPMALSAASQRLKKLEQLYGVPLVERHSRGVTLTEAGETLRLHAKGLIRGTEALNDEMGRLSSGMRREIRVCGNTMATSVFLPERLGAFLASEPDVDVRLTERPSRQIVPLIEHDEIDIGVIDGSLGVERLTLLPFARDRLVLVCAAGHPFSRRDTVAFTELLDEPFVGLTPAIAMQRFIEGMAQLKGHSLRIRVRTPGFASLAAIVGSGAGVGILPERSACQLAPTHGLAAIALTDPWAERELKLCFKEEVLGTPARRLLATLLGTSEVRRTDGAAR
ncbi:LysR family transcriptional regulator [Crenobacter caeni]|uniref:LysR family transcriptional regulator n=1 Tax=Crenobacter caeni TaxID=2705474 RepID=A0A6B2KS00_9NEIS|nr:LysR family transcriptional regulator [Crenobacter caeni]NDV13022.1 LysR family transcriptional regulator [Crenobacter caeni]